MNFLVFSYIFILFAWSRALVRYRDGSISRWELGLWTLIWVVAGIVIGWPGVTATMAQALGIGRGADFIVYASIILVFYLVFRLYIKIGIAERELTRLIRAMAIKEVKDKQQ